MKVIAVSNQKGGQGKTAVTSNLGVVLAEAGLRTLVIDLDPQSALTRQLIGRKAADLLPFNIETVFTDGVHLAVAVASTSFGMALVPSSRGLVGAEIGLVTTTKREMQLARALRPVADDYDVVLIDCPPNLGLLTVNAFAACDEVLCPVSAEDEGGVSGVGEVQMSLSDLYADEPDNMPAVKAVITRWEARRTVAQDVDKALRKWPDITYLESAKIPNLAPHHKATQKQTPAMLMPIKDPKHRGIGKAYRKLARELGLVDAKERR